MAGGTGAAAVGTGGTAAGLDLGTAVQLIQQAQQARAAQMIQAQQMEIARREQVRAAELARFERFKEMRRAARQREEIRPSRRGDSSDGSLAPGGSGAKRRWSYTVLGGA